MYEGSEGTFDFDEDILKGIMAPRALKLIKECVSTEENIIPASIRDLEDVLKEVVMYLP